MTPMGSIPSLHGITMGYPIKRDGIAMGSGWDLTQCCMGFPSLRGFHPCSGRPVEPLKPKVPHSLHENSCHMTLLLQFIDPVKTFSSDKPSFEFGNQL